MTPNKDLAHRPSTVFVAGATGYVGTEFRRLCPRTIRAIPIARRPTGGGGDQMILYPGLSGSPGLLSRSGRATILHVMGCSREATAGAIYEGNVVSTRRLLASANHLGADRVVYLSGYGIGGPTTSAYYQAKAAAEGLIRASGMPHVILRCSYIVGGSDELTPAIQRQARRGCVVIPGDGAYRIQPLLVDDVVAIIAALATTHRNVCGTFDLVGEAVTYRRFVCDVAEGVAEDVRLVEQDLAPLIREATFNAEAAMSVCQIAILVADKIGPPITEFVGVRVREYEEVRRAIAAD